MFLSSAWELYHLKVFQALACLTQFGISVIFYCNCLTQNPSLIHLEWNVNGEHNFLKRHHKNCILYEK